MIKLVVGVAQYLSTTRKFSFTALKLLVSCTVIFVHDLFLHRMTSASIEVRTNPHCLVCNSRVSVSTRNSYQIFNNQVQTCSERPVNCIMSTVLGKELTETNVHSLIICKKCFKLFNEVDELEMR